MPAPGRYPEGMEKSDLFDMIRTFAERPGATLRLYHIVGSKSGEAWQGSVTWDGDGGEIASGFKVGVRHDPIDALADIVRQALLYPNPAVRERAPLVMAAPKRIADDLDDLLGSTSPSVPATTGDDLEDLLG